MRQGITRWTIYLLCLCIVGPAAGALTGALRASDGSHAASPLFCTSPGLGLAAGVGALVLALIMGLLAAKFVSTAAGFTAAGLVVAWAAWRTGDVDDMIRAAQSGGPLLWQVVEGAFFGILGLLVAVVLFAWGRAEHEPRQDRVPGDVAVAHAVARSFASILIRVFKGKGGLAVLPVAVIAAAVAGWLIGVNPHKGQAVFAAIAAGVLGGAAGRLVDFEVSLPSLVLPIVVLGVIGPLTGFAFAGGGGIVHAAYKGTLFPLANITALDWIAGALLGIPVGVAWAGSMMEKKA
jgi:hypothetical protein